MNEENLLNVLAGACSGKIRDTPLSKLKKADADVERFARGLVLAEELAVLQACDNNEERIHLEAILGAIKVSHIFALKNQAHWAAEVAAEFEHAKGEAEEASSNQA